MSEEERRRRLAAVYDLLLKLAAEKRAQKAAGQRESDRPDRLN
jgi:hypothetical protein